MEHQQIDETKARVLPTSDPNQYCAMRRTCPRLSLPRYALGTALRNVQCKVKPSLTGNPMYSLPPGGYSMSTTRLASLLRSAHTLTEAGALWDRCFTSLFRVWPVSMMSSTCQYSAFHLKNFMRLPQRGGTCTTTSEREACSKCARTANVLDRPLQRRLYQEVEENSSSDGKFCVKKGVL